MSERTSDGVRRLVAPLMPIHFHSTFGQHSPPGWARGWLGRALSVLAATLVVILGFFFLALVLGFLAIFGLITAFRFWWRIKSSPSRSSPSRTSPSRSSPSGSRAHDPAHQRAEVIEGEYTVMEDSSTEIERPARSRHGEEDQPE